MEPVIGRVFVRFIIVEDIISVNCPSSGNPLMKLLVDNSLFRQLEVKLLLSWVLELCVDMLSLIIMMLMMMLIVPMTMTACTTNWLVSQCLNKIDDEIKLNIH